MKQNYNNIFELKLCFPWIKQEIDFKEKFPIFVEDNTHYEMIR